MHVAPAVAAAAAAASSMCEHMPDTLALSERLRCRVQALPVLAADWTRLLDLTIYTPATTPEPQKTPGNATSSSSAAPSASREQRKGTSRHRQYNQSRPGEDEDIDPRPAYSPWPGPGVAYSEMRPVVGAATSGTMLDTTADRLEAGLGADVNRFKARPRGADPRTRQPPNWPMSPRLSQPAGVSSHPALKV